MLGFSRFTGFVYRDNGGRFPARGKDVGRPGPVEDGEKMLWAEGGDVLVEDKL